MMIKVLLIQTKMIDIYKLDNVSEELATLIKCGVPLDIDIDLMHRITDEEEGQRIADARK